VKKMHTICPGVCALAEGENRLCRVRPTHKTQGRRLLGVLSLGVSNSTSGVQTTQTHSV